MRLVDLSTPVRTDHFRWPVERRLAKSHDTGAGQATRAGWNVHAFTHMDSQRHVDFECQTAPNIFHPTAPKTFQFMRSVSAVFAFA